MGGCASLCVSLLAPLALAKICPKIEETGISWGMHLSSWEGVVCALPSLVLFSTFLELSSLTNKLHLNRCWLSSPHPTVAAQRPGNRLLLSWHVSLYQFRDFSHCGRSYFGLVFKGHLIDTLCLAFPPCPLLLIPYLSQPRVLTTYKVCIPKRMGGGQEKILLLFPRPLA